MSIHAGVTLPGAGPIELSANIHFGLDEYVAVSTLTGQLGASDIQGNLHWDMSTSPPAIKVRLESQQLHAGDFGIGDPQTRNADQGHTEFWDQPHAIGTLGAVELDIEVQVQWQGQAGRRRHGTRAVGCLCRYLRQDARFRPCPIG